MRGDSERCLAAGCSGFLTKPINPQKLIERIGEILAGSDVPDEVTGEAIAGVPGEGPLTSELPMDDPDFAEIVGEFAERFGQKLAEMHASNAAGDMQNLAQLAHWLAGAGGSAGFPLLTTTAHALESAIKQNMANNVDQQLSRLRGLLVRMRDAVSTPA
jgi:HPt (histidine-containing phosphotransfer) domain-containing protein